MWGITSKNVNGCIAFWLEIGLDCGPSERDLDHKSSLVNTMPQRQRNIIKLHTAVRIFYRHSKFICHLLHNPLWSKPSRVATPISSIDSLVNIDRKGLLQQLFNCMHEFVVFGPIMYCCYPPEGYVFISVGLCVCLFVRFVCMLAILRENASKDSHNLMMTSSNGNIFRVTGHFCGELTGRRWIPRTKACDAELWCFLWSAPE